MITLKITVEEVLYENGEDWSVIRFKSGNESFKAAGNIGGVKKGETWEIKGEWESTEEYGKQFKITEGILYAPNTQEELIALLSGSHFRGIGTATASQLVKHYGIRLWEILEHNPMQLVWDRIITDHKAHSLIKASEKLKIRWNALRFLVEHRLPIRILQSLTTLYREEVVEKLKENPYRLLSFTNWENSERVARSLGLPSDDKRRIEAGIIYILQKHLFKGNTAVLKHVLIRESMQLLSISSNKISELLTPPLVSIISNMVQLNGIASQEKTVAKVIASMCADPKPLADFEWVEQWICKYEKKKKITLETEQKYSIYKAVFFRFTLLTGGAGTGKTSVIDAIASILEELGQEVELAAPTGKASKRIQKSTKKEAKTLHRAFGYSQRKFSFEKTDEPIRTLIVDESSMTDLRMWHTIMTCVDENSRLIFVGDSAQLPPIGAGQIYHELLSHPNLNAIRLNKIHRQAEDNPIPYVSLAIQKGDMPVLPSWKRELLKGVYFVSQEDESKGTDWIVKIATGILPQQGVSFEDIQILCPKKKGISGTENINELIRTKLGLKNISSYLPFAIGDRVIQTANNYDLGEDGIMNGTVGIVVEELDEGMRVEFEDEEKVIFNGYSIFDLDYANAISVHKSQGSQYRVVIIPVYSSADVLLSRQLIYTGITRATDLVILVGVEEVLKKAITKDQTSMRVTAFSCHFKELFK